MCRPAERCGSVHHRPGRIAQRESVPFTRERSKVRSLVRPPSFASFGWASQPNSILAKRAKAVPQKLWRRPTGLASATLQLNSEEQPHAQCCQGPRCRDYVFSEIILTRRANQGYDAIMRESRAAPDGRPERDLGAPGFWPRALPVQAAASRAAVCGTRANTAPSKSRLAVRTTDTVGAFARSAQES